MYLVLALLSVAVLVLLAAIIVVVARGKAVEVVTMAPPQQRAVVPPPPTPEELVRSGKKIEAIKRYREVNKVDLRTAKAAIDAMADGGAGLPSKGSVLRQVNDADIEHQIRTGHLIDAVKLYREKTGVGLKEAKDAVEALRHRMRAS